MVNERVDARYRTPRASGDPKLSASTAGCMCASLSYTRCPKLVIFLSLIFSLYRLSKADRELDASAAPTPPTFPLLSGTEIEPGDQEKRSFGAYFTPLGYLKYNFTANKQKKRGREREKQVAK